MEVEVCVVDFQQLEFLFDLGHLTCEQNSGISCTFYVNNRESLSRVADKQNT